jgi:16S rRNA (cytosine1402-N4)-methyltransferase
MYHIPVLLQESIQGLEIKPDGTYVDVTFGGGGHSRAILDKLKDGRLIAFDQDKDAESNIPDHIQFTFIRQNFRYMKNFLKLEGITQVDGILADLGVSSHQFDLNSRGFSTRLEGPLDMRMNPDQSTHAGTVINTYDEDRLYRIFREYGEIKNANCVVGRIIENRPIETTEQLSMAVKDCFPSTKLNKFLAMVFQAIRIEVNQELQALQAFLKQTSDVLKSGGRLVVISYHSLEDRLVKHFMKTGNFEGKLEKDFYGKPMVDFRMITGRPIVPGPLEIEENSRARSAKLRIAEKI